MGTAFTLDGRAVEAAASETLWQVARREGVDIPRLCHSACTPCTRCLRACRDEQNNDVIGLGFRSGQAQIVFDMGDAMGASTCVACGEGVQACSTGALAPAGGVANQQPDRSVNGLCPYCGVGCQVTVAGGGARSGAVRHPAPAGAAGRWRARWAPEAVSPHGLKPCSASQSLRGLPAGPALRSCFTS